METERCKILDGWYLQKPGPPPIWWARMRCEDHNIVRWRSGLHGPDQEASRVPGQGSPQPPVLLSLAPSPVSALETLENYYNSAITCLSAGEELREARLFTGRPEGCSQFHGFCDGRAVCDDFSFLHWPHPHVSPHDPKNTSYWKPVSTMLSY